ncbi:ATP-binding protein [Lysobacter auxotrophicus]|uniref:histidine kinase n=1 Tax=Lysobacter auxotrophicus TaxID=2992573 RepID=A0ABM8DCX6_9GAMM|nr:ATP-binding protein [Lysobacter auxotrophicus]BDU16450.1 PAS domain S-box protein [Lysobacter auxotrophicus]
MSWVQIAWPMLAAASLTLGLIHALIWIRQRSVPQHLAFACAAVSLSILAILELMAVHARGAHELGTLIRWMHVPTTALVVSLVVFTRLSFGNAYLSLAATAIALRLAGLVANFTMGANLNFAAIQEVGRVRWPGDVWVAYPIGAANPWVVLNQLSNVLLAVYIALLLISMMRSADAQLRRHAMIICGGWLLFIGLLMLSSLAMTLNFGKTPFIGTPSFVFVIAAMSYQLGSDLLESNRLAARLRESEVARLQGERDLQHAAQAAGVGLWSWNIPDDRIVGSSKAQEWFGEHDHECVLASVMRRIHPNDRPHLRSAIEDAWESGTFTTTFRLARNEPERWLTVTGEMEFDAQGRALAMRGVARDDTDSRLSGERFRALLEAAPSAILLIDEAGRICLLNAEVERMFGYAREELLGRDLERLLPESMRGAHVRHRQMYSLGPTKRVMGNGHELHGLRQDGTEFPIEVGLNPIRFGDQTLTLAAVTDTSERRRKDAELSLRRDEVAHLSRVTMLGELSGSLAHELNQPLAAILSNAQAAQRMLLRNPEDLSEIGEILSDIVDNDRRAGDVIRRLRTLLRKGSQDLTRIDINETVRECLRLLRSDLRNRDVVVVLDLAPGLPAIEGDQVQLQQVLLNLIFNACDAMAGEDGRHLTVHSHSRRDSVRLTVADDGPGIATGMHERIFEPFQTSKPNGLGLGLAICRTIVESHRGRLWAENGAGGRGAHLHIELPAARVE